MLSNLKQYLNDHPDLKELIYEISFAFSGYIKKQIDNKVKMILQ